MANSLIEMAIQRAIMGFPPGSDGESQTMQLFEFALQRAMLGFPSVEPHGPPDYSILLYRPPPALER